METNAIRTHRRRQNFHTTLLNTTCKCNIVQKLSSLEYCAAVSHQNSKENGWHIKKTSTLSQRNGRAPQPSIHVVIRGTSQGGGGLPRQRWHVHDSIRPIRLTVALGLKKTFGLKNAFRGQVVTGKLYPELILFLGVESAQSFNQRWVRVVPRGEEPISDRESQVVLVQLDERLFQVCRVLHCLREGVSLELKLPAQPRHAERQDLWGSRREQVRLVSAKAESSRAPSNYQPVFVRSIRGNDEKWCFRGTLPPNHDHCSAVEVTVRWGISHRVISPSPKVLIRLRKAEASASRSRVRVVIAVVWHETTGPNRPWLDAGDKRKAIAPIHLPSKSHTHTDSVFLTLLANFYGSRGALFCLRM